LPDASLRARRLADADVLLGAAMASSNPAAATAALTRAVDFYRRADVAFALPEALLLRARCALRTGASDAAARDLEEGMTILERHRDRVAGAAGTGILNADQALFAEAIRMHLERNENAAAFEIAERSRGAKITVAELQARLAGSATAVLEIVVLPDAMASFVVSENDFRVTRRDARGTALATLGDASLAESGTEAAAALYEQLVRPVDGLRGGARHLIVVPDPLLQRVPFAALFDAMTSTYLVEHVSVAVASSAASLQRTAGTASTSVVTVALPSGAESGTAALPQAERELAEIAAFYRRATTVPAAGATLSSLRDALGAADVVHVAGHTQQQRAGGEHALLLADHERVSSRSVVTRSLPNARLLVLAACETLRPPASNDTRALSLGAAFVAAGVPDVIGTLTPVGDRDARTFFRELHRHLASQVNPAEALRAAQIDALRQRTGGSHAWRSIALLTRRIDTGGKP
jgi:CHAT domain-containing protein